MMLHLPTLLYVSVAMMAMSAALMTVFGRTQRVYRGFWWWTAAQWLGTLGLALQVLRESHPALLPLSNLLLLQWPIVTLAGVRRFFPRHALPRSAPGRRPGVRRRVPALARHLGQRRDLRTCGSRHSAPRPACSTSTAPR